MKRSNSASSEQNVRKKSSFENNIKTADIHVQDSFETPSLQYYNTLSQAAHGSIDIAANDDVSVKTSEPRL